MFWQLKVPIRKICVKFHGNSCMNSKTQNFKPISHVIEYYNWLRFYNQAKFRHHSDKNSSIFYHPRFNRSTSHHRSGTNRNPKETILDHITTTTTTVTTTADKLTVGSRSRVRHTCETGHDSTGLPATARDCLQDEIYTPGCPTSHEQICMR